MIPRVYVASKLRHSAYIIRLAGEYPDIHWTARWPYIEGKVEDSPANARMFWLHDMADIQQADFVLVVPSEPPDSPLRGALVEVGYGLGQGKHIVLVGESVDYGTWKYHPMVSQFQTMTGALNFICGDWR